jgi:hypothetical protein
VGHGEKHWGQVPPRRLKGRVSPNTARRAAERSELAYSKRLRSGRAAERGACIHVWSEGAVAPSSAPGELGRRDRRQRGPRRTLSSCSGEHIVHLGRRACGPRYTTGWVDCAPGLRRGCRMRVEDGGVGKLVDAESCRTGARRQVAWATLHLVPSIIPRSPIGCTT